MFGKGARFVPLPRAKVSLLLVSLLSEKRPYDIVFTLQQLLSTF